MTGIAISALTGDFEQYGNIVRGTIAAAAVIKKFIADFLSPSGILRTAGGDGKGYQMTNKNGIMKRNKVSVQ